MKKIEYGKYLKVAAPNLLKILGAVIFVLSLAWQYHINSQIEYYTKFAEAVHTLSSIFYEEIDEKEACKDANSTACLSYRKLIESTDKMEASVVGIEEELRKSRESLKSGTFWLSLAGAIIAIVGAIW